MGLSKKETRKKFGLAGGPIAATRVLARELDHDFGVPAHALIIINDEAGTFTAANVYGGNLGRAYDPDAYTHPLPESNSGKWKVWAKRGYTVSDVSKWDILKAQKTSTAKRGAKAQEVKA